MKQIQNSEKSDEFVDKFIWMEFLIKNEKEIFFSIILSDCLNHLAKYYYILSLFLINCLLPFPLLIFLLILLLLLP